jgi:hypothetical protein
MAVPLRAEYRQRRARAVERAHEVDVHHPPHRVAGRLLDRAVVAEAGIADHDVERAECLARARHEPRHVGLGRDVHHDRLGAPAGRANAADRLVQPVGAACAQHDRNSFLRELLRRREPDAGRRPCDHRDARRHNHSRIIQCACGPRDKAGPIASLRAPQRGE